MGNQSLPIRREVGTAKIKERAGAGIGVVLVAPSGLRVEEALELNEKVTNNEVEYEALIYRLEMASSLGIEWLRVRADSKLVTKKVSGNFDVKEPRMATYFNIVKHLRAEFMQSELIKILREMNHRADDLAKKA
ncbi:uncharacterized protein LOC133832937 [Humulus lupulus]|uniref:uncharacterized protein LOC133832937 n=1 Tax=Humulus lupulus TaxID=3486 RepID=UPI002B4165EC|nr:uncharacterized protein LOC133832937 [Humulus lupulus]